MHVLLSCTQITLDLNLKHSTAVSLESWMVTCKSWSHHHWAWPAWVRIIFWPAECKHTRLMRCHQLDPRRVPNTTTAALLRKAIARPRRLGGHCS